MHSSVVRAALALLLLAPACAASHQSADQGSPAPDEPVVLDVANHTWSEVNIFILASTVRARVGDVTSQGTTRIVIPRDLLAYGSIQVRVDRIGGGAALITPGLDVHAGQHITLYVEEQANLSSWVVEKLNRW